MDRIDKETAKKIEKAMQKYIRERDLESAAQMLHRRGFLKLSANQKFQLINLFRDDLSKMNQPFKKHSELDMLSDIDFSNLKSGDNHRLEMDWCSLAKEDLELAKSLFADDDVFAILKKDSVSLIKNVLVAYGNAQLTREVSEKLKQKMPELHADNVGKEKRPFQFYKRS